jgi:hypothetical protein
VNYSNSQRAGVILYLTAVLFGAYKISVSMLVWIPCTFFPAKFFEKFLSPILTESGGDRKRQELSCLRSWHGGMQALLQHKVCEWLLIKPTEEEQKDIFELLHHRRKKSSTIF